MTFGISEGVGGGEGLGFGAVVGIDDQDAAVAAGAVVVDHGARGEQLADIGIQKGQVFVAQARAQVSAIGLDLWSEWRRACVPLSFFWRDGGPVPSLS